MMQETDVKTKTKTDVKTKKMTKTKTEIEDYIFNTYFISRF